MKKGSVFFSIVVLIYFLLPSYVFAEEVIQIEPVFETKIDEGAMVSYALELINSKRAEAGLHPVKIDVNLENLAKYYVEKMAKANVASHNVDGKGMRERAIDFGIKLSKDFKDNNFTENIAWGLYSCLSGCNFTPETELERRINEFIAEKRYNGPHYRTIYHQDFNAVGIAFHFIKSSETKGKFFVAFEYAKIDEIETPGGFYDIPTDSMYLESSRALREEGILIGYDNFFLPNKPISRVEALKVLFKTFKIEISEGLDTEITDVEKADWYYPYITTAEKRGVVSGYHDLTFRPDNQISRVEALKIALESKVVALEENKHVTFQDILPDDWFNPYIVYAYENNLMSFNSKTFQVNEPITRGDFVRLIYLLREKS